MLPALHLWCSKTAIFYVHRLLSMNLDGCFFLVSSLFIIFRSSNFVLVRHKTVKGTHILTSNTSISQSRMRKQQNQPPGTILWGYWANTMCLSGAVCLFLSSLINFHPVFADPKQDEEPSTHVYWVFTRPWALWVQLRKYQILTGMVVGSIPDIQGTWIL